MTVGNVTIERIKDLNWFKVTFTSQKNGIGETSTEMLISSDTLRSLCLQMNKAEGKKPDYSKDPENIRKFMEDADKL